MRRSSRERLERRRAELAAGDRRSRLMFIGIIAVFTLLALVIFIKNRAPSGPVDINRASAAELERLPEIGPEMAKAIVKGRPYETPKDLLKVKGIGPKTLEKVRPLVEWPAE